MTTLLYSCLVLIFYNRGFQFIMYITSIHYDIYIYDIPKKFNRDLIKSPYIEIDLIH